MNELIAKYAKQIEDINLAQSAALVAADADGVSEEDRAKHLAEFDKLQGDKAKAQASLKRAEQLVRDQAAANAPARPAVTQDTYNPHEPVAATQITIPARARRHGPLVAYKDREREAYMAGLWFAGALCADYRDHERSQYFRAKAREMGLQFIEDPNASYNTAPQANLTGLSNQSGGIFVPDIVDTAILTITLDYGVLRRLAEIVPMTSDTKTTPRYSARMTAYWIGRGNKPTQSDPSWNAIQLIAKDLAAMTKIGRQVNEDSLVDLGEQVTRSMAEAFALAEDDAGFNGDGTSTYGGVNGLITRVQESANSACLITATGHTTLSALTNSDFTAVEAAAPNYLGADWRWYCHKSVYWNSMANLGLVAGGNRVDTIAAGPNTRLFHGYPVEFVNVMPSAPGSGAVAALFADLKMSVKLGDRRGRTVQAGYENDDFTKQLMTILGTERVDINVHTVKDPLGDSRAVGGPIMALKLG